MATFGGGLMQTRRSCPQLRLDNFTSIQCSVVRGFGIFFALMHEVGFWVVLRVPVFYPWFTPESPKQTPAAVPITS